MSEGIRLVIIDDHAMVRSGLAMFIDTVSGITLVGQGANGLEAIKLCDELMPDVVLMDLMMPKMDGVKAIQAITRKHPMIRIIALTSFKEEEMVRAALEAGAMSYLLKNANVDVLAGAIKDAYDGNSVLAPEATQALIQATRQPAPRPGQLTERERDVLTCMVKGKTNRQIANDLEIGFSTVKFHVSSILSKLNVSSRTEAVALALQHHLVD